MLKQQIEARVQDEGRAKGRKNRANQVALLMLGGDRGRVAEQSEKLDIGI